ncbi:MAG: hypothetical protein IJD38_00375 [Clostridia bacterium]|nr:hypothetical protein [Clostridia bacterium]
MRSSLKRLLALMLAALMLLSLAACGTTEENPDQSESLTGSDVEDDTENQDYVCDLPEDLNYGNEEINFMYVKVAGRDDELISENLGNGTIPDAVYERNLAVENQLKVKLVFNEQTTDALAQAAINTAVKGGDRTLDIFVIGTYCAVSPAIQGCYLNLNAVENVDTTKHYWSQDYNNIVTFTSDNKQYLATSPAALSLFRLTYLTIFNRELFNDRKIPDLYETVDNGEWTLEYQYQLAADAWVDSDGNGKESKDDFYGFITGSCISVDAYCTASDIHLVTRDETGYMVYNADKLDALVDMAEKVSTLYNAQGTYVFQGQPQDDIGLYYIIEKFAEQQGLMATTQFLSIETHIESLAEFSYGIVPMPKLTREQDAYKTYVQDQVSAFGISAAIGDEKRQAMLGAVMESLAYNSYKIVRPAYYDSALSLRFMQDPQSRAILDTMFETIAFDYTYVTDVGGVRGTLRTLLPSKSPAIASRAKSWQRTISKQLERDNAAIEKLP